MFVRAKKRKDQTYYYLVKSIREDSKIKQHVVAYLGRSDSLDAAIHACLKGMNDQRGWQQKFYQTAIQHPKETLWLDNAHAASAKAKKFEQRLEAYLALLATAPEAIQAKVKKTPARQPLVSSQASTPGA